MCTFTTVLLRWSLSVRHPSLLPVHRKPAWRSGGQETVDGVGFPKEAAPRRGRFGLMNVTRIQLEWLAEYANEQAMLDMSTANSTFMVRRPVLPVKD